MQVVHWLESINWRTGSIHGVHHHQTVLRSSFAYVVPLRRIDQPKGHSLKHKLLIVDDSNVSRLMIRGRFTALQPDWELMEAASGDEAVAKVAAAPPDFITMDVNMPGINGFEAAELIQRSHPQVKIVILTANIQGASRDKAEQLQVKFVQKPATQAAIQQAIDYFLAAP